MDRQRVIEKLRVLEADGAQYKIVKELGRGGNGVAFAELARPVHAGVPRVFHELNHEHLDQTSAVFQF